MSNGLFAGGTGTEEDPFLVEDALDLIMVGTHFTGSVYQGVNHSYLQVSDIDLKDVSFNPIGESSLGPPFMGNYDGGNFKIKNLTIKNDTFGNLGLFGLVSSKAKIKNIRISSATIIGNKDGMSIGLLAGTLSGAYVDNCHVEGTLTSNKDSARIGGLAGSIINSEIKEVLIEGKISGVGKLYGVSESGYGSIYVNCLVRSEISILEEEMAIVGLFVASIDGSVIENCIVLTVIKDAHKARSTILWGNDPYVTGIVTKSLISGSKAFEEWNKTKSYPYGAQIVGSDGNFYKSFRPQEVDPKEYETDRPLNVQPISGADWEVYWAKVDDEKIKTDEHLKDPATYTGWDLENIWMIGPNGPELQIFYTPSEEIPDDDDIPSDIVIVTDVDFTKTKMMHDFLGRAIPQVWDHENKRFVPVTLQMIELMIKR